MYLSSVKFFWQMDYFHTMINDHIDRPTITNIEMNCNNQTDASVSKVVFKSPQIYTLSETTFDYVEIVKQRYVTEWDSKDGQGIQSICLSHSYERD